MTVRGPPAALAGPDLYGQAEVGDMDEPIQPDRGEQARTPSQPERVGEILQRMLQNGELPALEEAILRETPDAA